MTTTGPAARTRELILDALADLLAEEHPAAISVPAVAGRAGVSVRTVYRYFPTKSALIDAASTRFHDRYRPGSPSGSTGGLVSYLRTMWAAFADDVDAVRAEHISPAGRELRARRLPIGRATVEEGLDSRVASLPAGDRARLVDLVVFATSSSAFLELVDRLGHPPDEAAAMAAWAVRAMTETAARDGAVPTGSEP